MIFLWCLQASQSDFKLSTNKKEPIKLGNIDTKKVASKAKVSASKETQVKVIKIAHFFF